MEVGRKLGTEDLSRSPKCMMMHLATLAQFGASFVFVFCIRLGRLIHKRVHYVSDLLLTSRQVYILPNLNVSHIALISLSEFIVYFGYSLYPSQPLSRCGRIRNNGMSDILSFQRLVVLS